MASNDGGPAFPRRQSSNYIDDSEDGMSLRDWFAGMAMQYCAQETSIIFKGVEISDVEVKDAADLQGKLIAKTAYDIADAMLKAREEKND